MPAEELRAAGLNDSVTHVDFMFGSAETDIDGLLPGGGREPLVRAGEWSGCARPMSRRRRRAPAPTASMGS